MSITFCVLHYESLSHFSKYLMNKPYAYSSPLNVVYPLHKKMKKCKTIQIHI